VGLSFFKDLIYIPKIQLTTEKKGQGMAKAKSKNPVGRPKFEVTEEVLARTERAMSQGLTKEQCAGVLGISVSTFQLYQAEYSEFSEAIKKGEASGIEQVTNALFENATVERDNVAIIFYLKNRAGWVDKTETKIHEERTVTLDLTRIGTDELAAIEHAFIKSNAGAGQGREVPQIIEGVYESSLADD
jgi:hypothetical protein